MPVRHTDEIKEYLQEREHEITRRVCDIAYQDNQALQVEIDELRLIIAAMVKQSGGEFRLLKKNLEACKHVRYKNGPYSWAENNAERCYILTGGEEDLGNWNPTAGAW